MDKYNDDSRIGEAGLEHFYRNVETEDSIINNKLNMNEHFKSFLITFVVAFSVVFVSQIDTLTLATFETGAIFGVLFAALRAGVKAVLEFVISQYSK